MATVEFTPNLAKHIETQSLSVSGSTLGEVLSAICQQNTQLKRYLVDDQDRLRKHVTVFIDNTQVRDRIKLSDPVGESSTVYIAQALSGG